MEEAASGDAPPGIGFSFEGHGENAWAIRAFTVVPGLAILMDRPFGGAYMDQEAAVLQLSLAFTDAAKLLEAAGARPLDADPVVVHHQGLRGSRWCVADGSPTWHEETDANQAATEHLSAA